MTKISIDDQIAEVAREIALRQNVYRTRVARAQMTQAEADKHLATMEAVAQTLNWLKANEAAIRAAVEKKPPPPAPSPPDYVVKNG